ncbi:hypothetical protein TNIN_231651 [Trichonephila inaurata madagascariensis]|uniref:Uncharacterized protein n=1 Tax=Trichonephila inaurata madagascariensis TaxID=2747483 RepID=A0A8X6XB13_9ARAC|nr:hypothetical protein TNIN_231651 [Trichonephila inaurata madagascariensis]
MTFGKRRRKGRGKKLPPGRYSWDRGVFQGSLEECEITCAVVTDHAMSSFVAAHACYMDRVLSHDPHTTCLAVDPHLEEETVVALRSLGDANWQAGRDVKV